MLPLLPTTLVGSYRQPEWLIDRKNLAGRLPPRVRARELWRVAPEWLEAAQDDATLIAIRDQERAGLDIITDGEMRRESYSNRFATALEGVDLDNYGTALYRSGHPNRYRGSSGRSGASTRFRSGMSDFCGLIRTAPSKSRFPAHSPWPRGAERFLPGRRRNDRGLRRRRSACGPSRIEIPLDRRDDLFGSGRPGVQPYWESFVLLERARRFRGSLMVSRISRVGNRFGAV